MIAICLDFLSLLLFVGSDDEQDCNGDRYPRIVNLILTNLDLKLALCFLSMNLLGLMENFKNALIVRVYFLFCEADLHSKSHGMFRLDGGTGAALRCGDT